MSRILDYFRGESANSPAERKLVRKIDMTLLPILCLMYWSNYLNRTNFQFAYVSGMRQDLGYVGNQFTVTNTIFTVGYTVGQIPHSYFVTKLPARIYFPTCALLWSVLGACLSATTSVEQVYAIRFLIALIEACTFSGSHYLLASWYKPSELGKRAGLFACSAQLGSLFSGVLQGAIYDTLNGVHGRSGWRWTYIIDGVVGLAIALIAFCIFPSTPAMGASPFFTAEERLLAQDRLIKRVRTPLSVKNILKIVLTYKYVGFCVLFMIGSQLEAYGTNGIMPQWLASLNAYPTSRLSYYALGLTSLAIVATVVAGIATDIFGRRWVTVFPLGFGMIISSSIILAWDVPRGALFFAFYLGGIGYIQQGSFFAWANEASTSDLERAVILFSMNLWSNAWTAWWILLFWSASDAPRFRKGMISTIPIAVFVMVWATGLRYLEIRERKRNRALGLNHGVEAAVAPTDETAATAEERKEATDAVTTARYGSEDEKLADEKGEPAVVNPAYKSPDDKF